MYILFTRENINCNHVDHEEVYVLKEGNDEEVLMHDLLDKATQHWWYCKDYGSLYLWKGNNWEKFSNWLLKNKTRPEGLFYFKTVGDHDLVLMDGEYRADPNKLSAYFNKKYAKILYIDKLSKKELKGLYKYIGYSKFNSSVSFKSTMKIAILRSSQTDHIV